MKLDLTGLRVGHLTVVERIGMTKSGALWRCSCDCGGEALRITSQLRKGYKNVGCKACEAERRSKWTALRTHGHCEGGKTKLYMVWKGMKSRCRDVGDTSWKWYGAAGVTVCTEWEQSYEAFHDWAMQSGYEPGLTIDRKDPRLGYSPSNCKWATKKEQMNNLRIHHKHIEASHV